MPRARYSLKSTLLNIIAGLEKPTSGQILFNKKIHLERLNEKELVELDEERKAAMVSNLLVVLCGNHDAQPVVNSGSLY